LVVVRVHTIPTIIVAVYRRGDGHLLNRPGNNGDRGTGNAVTAPTYLYLQVHVRDSVRMNTEKGDFVGR